MNQIIYILTNEAMPGYVKVGMTTTGLEQKIRELSASISMLKTLFEDGLR